MIRVPCICGAFAGLCSNNYMTLQSWQPNNPIGRSWIMIFPSRLEGLFISGIDCLHWHELISRMDLEVCFEHSRTLEMSWEMSWCWTLFALEVRVFPRYADVGLPLLFYMSCFFADFIISDISALDPLDRDSRMPLPGYNASVHTPSKYFDKLSDVAWIC